MVDIAGQQAKFNIRLCDGDCALEAAKVAKEEKAVSIEVVGRVVDRQGEAYAQSLDTRSSRDKRPLALGAPIYRSDQLFTGEESYLLAAFPDGSRIALKSGSKFIVEDYRFQEPGYPDKAMFRFVRGGMRAVTGSLGKANHEAYSLETPVATVGIRGTVFDLLGDCDCKGEAIPGLIKGLYAAVHEGSIVLKNGQGEMRLEQDQGAHISGWKQKGEVISHFPQGMAKANARSPESKPVDIGELFKTETLEGAPPGLYLYAEAGHIRLIAKRGPHKGKVLNLGRHEAAYVSREGQLKRLTKPKSFQFHK